MIWLAALLLLLPLPAMALELGHVCHEDSDCMWVKGYVEPTETGPGKTLLGCVHKNTRLKENEWKLQNNFPAGHSCGCDQKFHSCGMK